MGIVTVLLLSLAAGDEKVEIDRPLPRLHVSQSFSRALTQKVKAKWRNVPLRQVLRNLSDSRRIAILLDRRIDPTRKTTLVLNGVKLLDGIAAIARSAAAQVAVVGNAVYVGPPKSVSALMLQMKKRSSESSRLSLKLPRSRRLALSRRRTLHWNDLDRPRDLVKKFAGQFKLKVAGLDKIPHDLWAGNTLPTMGVTRGLSLLLVQFDLTYRWQPDGSGIAIVPIPKAESATKN